MVIEGTLIRTYRRCPCCKDSTKQIVKNGKKISMILLNRSGNKRTYLRLKKQRYLCRACKNILPLGRISLPHSALFLSRFITRS
ncbi:transposase family protein (plasmid) [Enterococcus faecium]|nr:transposase family protein [Enterococcus faecium]